MPSSANQNLRSPTRRALLFLPLLGLGAWLLAFGLFPLFSSVPSLLAQAEEGTPLELLKKAEDPEQHPRFEGKKVSVDFSRSFPQVTYWKITHLGRKKERLEKFSPQGEKEEIVITIGPEKLHYFLRQGILVREVTEGENPSFDPQQKNIDLAKKNYSIETIGEGQLGARRVVRVHLRPLFAGRPRQEIWIDPQAGLSLRSEIYGQGGKLSTLESFSEMDLNPRFPENVLRLGLPEKVRRADFTVYPQPDLQVAVQRFGEPVLIPDFLPPGFVLKGIVLNQIGNYSRLQLIYSDGLTGLSIFQEKFEPAADQLLGLAPPGAEGFFSLSRGLTQLLGFVREGMKLVLVGEVEREDLERIAGSLKPAESKGGKSSD